MERDLWLMVYVCYILYFNSHAHVERDDGDLFYSLQLDNFNSHAHVERDVRVMVGNKLTVISTHTLTWSVTGCCNNCVFAMKKFQLTRSRGA